MTCDLRDTCNDGPPSQKKKRNSVCERNGKNRYRATTLDCSECKAQNPCSIIIVHREKDFIDPFILSNCCGNGTGFIYLAA